MAVLAHQLLHHIGDNKLDETPALNVVHPRQLGGEAVSVLHHKQHHGKFIRDQPDLEGFEGFLIRHQNIRLALQEPGQHIGPQDVVMGLHLHSQLLLLAARPPDGLLDKTQLIALPLSPCRPLLRE
ncbi:hypothetical protein D3C75_1109560 [compost metagenome]